MDASLRSYFLIRPDVTFLNHGSFGACPIPVLDEYQRWQREIETQPVEHISRTRLAGTLMAHARAKLGEYINADPDDLVYISNATVGINIIARSLKLGPGDEVLATDHEYGACDRAWRFQLAKNGASYRRVEIPVPVTTHEDFLDRFFAAVTSATKVIFISHITSPTALIFPIAEVCRRARELGILTVIDGAHAPGQIPLDLTAIDADFYFGNLHKWLCGPKGTAFLYARRDRQGLLDPLVVSWGWEAIDPGTSRFIDHHEYQGTVDMSGPLAIPAAIEFQRANNWDEVRRNCHEIVRAARPLIAEALGAVPIAPDSDEWYMQMSSFLLPSDINGVELQKRLYDEHRVEIPTTVVGSREAIRISIQGYNSWSDVERLLEGIEAVVGVRK